MPLTSHSKCSLHPFFTGMALTRRFLGRVVSLVGIVFFSVGYVLEIFNCNITSSVPRGPTCQNLLHEVPLLPIRQIQLDKIYKIMYINHMSVSKLIEFRGSALTDLRDFSISVRREAGYQLD